MNSGEENKNAEEDLESFDYYDEEEPTPTPDKNQISMITNAPPQM